MSQTVKADFLQTARDIFTGYMARCGLRKTPERYAVLDEVYKIDGHFDVDMLYDRMSKQKVRVSRATIYNTMEHLLKCELITKHQFGKSNFMYERSFAYKQHDHLICGDCEKVFEFCDPRLYQIQTTVEKYLGFSVTQHALNFYGHCNRLKQNGSCEHFKIKTKKK